MESLLLKSSPLPGDLSGGGKEPRASTAALSGVGRCGGNRPAPLSQSASHRRVWRISSRNIGASKARRSWPLAI